MSHKNKEKYSWEIPSHHKPERGKWWYIISGSIVLLMIFFSFFTIQNWHLVFLGVKSDFLFAFIMIVSVIIMIIHDSQPIDNIIFELDAEGVRVGMRRYDYDEIKHFYIIYKPDEDLKNLYLEFKNQLRPRLSIPLLDNDVLEIRDFLLKNLEEDLDKTEAPLSEQLTKLLKL